MLGSGDELSRVVDQDPSTRLRARLAVATLTLSLLTSMMLSARAVEFIVPPATPKATCRPTDTPERGLQGRLSVEDVSSGYARNGITCNTNLIGRYGKKEIGPGGAGGYKVLRYVDHDGHECAYYDTAAISPLNATHVAGDGVGVYVLDMSNPAHPVKTANLLTPAMLSPHESLSLNEKRGLLAAVSGFSVNPGILDVYDLTTDCRHPALRSSTPFGIYGHEGNFSPDGHTFWASSGGSCWNPATLTAIDVSDPSLPRTIWTSTNYRFHGLSVSDDGDRLYAADLGGQLCDPNAQTPSGLKILDVSQVQARATVPVVDVISTLTWPTSSIPQMTIPVSKSGHAYLIEIDEFARGNRNGDPTAPVGAGRIIDIGDELHPSVVSNLRLEVHQPENIPTVAGDPGASFSLSGYGGHYCSVPTQVEPDILACSFLQSGLRMFDIRDVAHPKEIAYFNAPVSPAAGLDNPTEQQSIPIHTPITYSRPAFDADQREIWYSDTNFGFFAVRIPKKVWPS